MASRGVAVLKFVGTISLGLLTGVSYSLSSLTVPTLLMLPSASTAARALSSLAGSAKRQLRALASLSGSAFLLAYFLSPRACRHPYLVYTPVLVLGSDLATSDVVAPYLFGRWAAGPESATAPAPRRRKTTQARMEASYEVLGGSSDAHSEGTSGSSFSGEEHDDDDHDDGGAADVNGEEVRGKVERFLKRQVAQSVLAGLGFAVAVVGIWGDGATHVYGTGWQ
ncbi:hypothetical protein P8C59_001353 [Phyllachora maydis]|uniref:Autophagy-related protein 33 n=1 Tax=Phyllachora maydis TaxID=1825666 RepID=A0AAD9HY81_9PEZI|nr:hypothetical protein P8C59_001353 [Phyllachora maydis]